MGGGGGGGGGVVREHTRRAVPRTALGPGVTTVLHTLDSRRRHDQTKRLCCDVVGGKSDTVVMW